MWWKKKKEKFLKREKLSIEEMVKNTSEWNKKIYLIYRDGLKNIFISNFI